MKELTQLFALLEEQEIRAVTYAFPDGPVDGYEWRYCVTRIAESGTSTEEVWSPWVFASGESIEKMLAQWTNFLAQQRIENPTLPPGSPRH